MRAASCRPSTYLISCSTAKASISGSSVVPGLPNTISTPSCLRSSRKARFPDMTGKAVSNGFGMEPGGGYRVDIRMVSIVKNRSRGTKLANWGIMAMSWLRPLIASAACVLWAAGAGAATLSPEEAAKHVGENAPICGLVPPAKYAAQARGGPTFFDFGKPYPNATFTALILGNDRAKFGTPEKALQGKQVCVTGQIQLYQGKPQ